MKIKSFLAKPYAAAMHSRVKKSMMNAVSDQHHIFEGLLKHGVKTQFGKDHHIKDVKNYQEYKQAVPVVDYEDIRKYIDLIVDGKQNVLWRGKPLYFAKTSGTTSGTKYIPITKDSISNHIDSARNALLCYMAESGKPGFADGKMIFLSGSPVLERKGGIPTGRLSGISNHHVPGYLRKNQLPSYETNCIDDWETKLKNIVEETFSQNMTLISGIPPWIQMYFDWLIQKSGNKSIKELFPQFQVLVHGGVNFEPYRQKLMDSIGGHIDTIETFPASEGFFAYQDTQTEEGLLITSNSGIFYEFIPANEIFDENPTRLSLEEVKLNENYALIVNSNAGLWGYNIGDMVKFVSLNPYRLVVTGRIKHFISAFGEHVIAEEVEHAISEACTKHNVKVNEFTVAPMINTDGELPYHEWLIEFEKMPDNLQSFSLEIDSLLRQKNIYYDDLVKGAILQPLKIRPMPRQSFINYMKSVGKLGGQNKTQRLSNDRSLADVMIQKFS